MEFEILFFPEKKGSEEELNKIKGLLNEAEEEVTRVLKLESLDEEIKVEVHFSSGPVREFAETPDGVYGDYSEEFNKIMLVHPEVIEPIYLDKYLEKYNSIIKQVIYKLYLTKYFMENNFSLFKKNAINNLALIINDSYKKELINRELLSFSKEKNISSKLSTELFLHAIRELNGREYLIEHVSEILDKKNLNALSKELFNEEPKEIIQKGKDKLIKNKEEEKRVR